MLGRIYPRAGLAVDYGLRPVDYAPGGAVDYGLRPVDYAPVGAVDYGLRPVDYARCGFPSTPCSGASIRACGAVEEAM